MDVALSIIGIAVLMILIVISLNKQREAKAEASEAEALRHTPEMAARSERSMQRRDAVRAAHAERTSGADGDAADAEA
jgi:hypothetical protein